MSTVMGEQFDVVGLPDPFGSRRERFAMAHRSTIDDCLVELVRRTEINPALLRHAAVQIGDRQIPKARWSTTRPAAGTRVIIKAVPGGSFGSLFVQIIGFAATFALPQFGPAISVLGKSISIGTALAKGVITVATTLIAQAIAPQAKQNLSSSDSGPADARFSITGTRNQAAPYGTIPKIFGKVVNYYPPLGAVPYTEIVTNNDQELRMVFVVGRGPLLITDIKIGSTPIANFKFRTVEIVPGWPSDPPVTLIPEQVREESLSIQLRQADGWSQRTTEPKTDEISFDITFPNGLQRISDRGQKFNLSVDFQCQYRAVGSSTWLDAPLQESGGFLYSVSAGNFTISVRSKAAVRRSIRFSVTRGQYQVRIRRTTIDDQAVNTGENQSITTENSFWTAIRSFKNEPPIKISGLAQIAVVIRATDQLNGVVDQLNCTVQSYLPVWNGSTWTTTLTRNPAWAFAEVLRGSGNARPLADSRLDLVALKTWADDNDALGLTFDGVFDFDSTVWEVLGDIAATGRASPTIKDSLYTVVQDKARTVPVQHFSPRNSRNFSAIKTFINLPHALKVRFPSHAALGQVEEIFVYADGYSVDNASVFEVLDLRYTTDAAQAWKHGRWVLAAAAARPEIYQLEVDFEHLVCTRGDLVRLTHDVPRFGIGAARVKTVVVDGGSNATAVTVDLPMPMEASGDYSARVRTASGASLLIPIMAVAGEQSTLTFVTPIPAASPQPVVGDLLLFGETGTESIEAIVRSIEPRTDLSAVMTFVDSAPAIHSAHTGPLPTFDAQITLPPIINRAVPPKPIILSVDSDEDALEVSNSGYLVPQIVIGVQLPTSIEGVLVTGFETQHRLSGSNDRFRTVTNIHPTSTAITIGPVEEGLTYEIDVRSVSEFGLPSAWVHLEHTVIGQTRPPKDIDRLFRDGKTITWAYPNPPIDFAGYQIRVNVGANTNYAQATPLHAGLYSDSTFDISGLAGTQTVMVKPIDIAGNAATNAAVITLNLGDPIVENILFTQDEDAGGFTGEIVDGTVVGGDELHANVQATALFYAGDTQLHWNADSANYWPGTTYASLVYTAAYSPATDHVGATISVRTTTIGDSVVDFREVQTESFYTADVSAFWSVTETDPFWAAAILSDWTRFPGSLGPLADTVSEFDFRITVLGGRIQGKITNFDIVIDVPDIYEYLNDVSIGTSGTQLPITQTYRVVDLVSLTVQDDGGSARFAEIRNADKDPDTGLFVDCYTDLTKSSQVAGTVDAIVKGH